MESPQKLKKLRIVIIVLAALLAVSLAALAVTVIRASAHGDSATVSIPGNITSGSAHAETAAYRTSTKPDGSRTQNAVSLSASGQARRVTLSLYRKQPEDNTPFNVVNMLPGDAVTQNYNVRVSHSGDVTVRFRAIIRPGYEKLAEVLMLRVKLLNTGETLYDGLMRDMPRSVNHKLTASGSTTSDLEYELTAYLDTSVGNEYQNQELVADFHWWVEGKEQSHLDSPKTGDDSHIVIFTVAAVAASIAVIILPVWRRREARRHG